MSLLRSRPVESVLDETETSGGMLYRSVPGLRLRSSTGLLKWRISYTTKPQYAKEPEPEKKSRGGRHRGTRHATWARFWWACRAPDRAPQTLSRTHNEFKIVARFMKNLELPLEPGASALRPQRGPASGDGATTRQEITDVGESRQDEASFRQTVPIDSARINAAGLR